MSMIIVSLMLLPFLLFGIFILYQALKVLLRFIFAWRNKDKKVMKETFLRAFFTFLFITFVGYSYISSSIKTYLDLEHRISTKGTNKIDEENLDKLVSTLSWSIEGAGFNLPIEKSYIKTFEDTSLYTSCIVSEVKTTDSFIENVKKSFTKESKSQYIYKTGSSDEGGGSDTTVFIKDEKNNIVQIRIIEWLD